MKTKNKKLPSTESLNKKSFSKYVYFIILYDGTKIEGMTFPFGFYETFEEAEQAVLTNKNNMRKDHFDHAIIEKIQFGQFKEVYSRWVYDYKPEQNKFILSHASEVSCDIQSFIGFYA